MTAAVDTMAYVNQVPWHGLGNDMKDGGTIDEWTESAGLTWNGVLTPVMYEVGDDIYVTDEKSVLYRDDTHVALGYVSPDFQIVQPQEVMEFFRDITELGDFTMETAGSLHGGKSIWALARSTKDATLSKDDTIKPYLFLATGMTGLMATRASFTTVRIVCNNTLQMAVKDSKNDAVRVTHRGVFNEKLAKQQLGLMDDSFNMFMANADKLATKQVTDQQRKDYFAELFLGERYITAEEEEQTRLVDASPTMQRVMDVSMRFPGQDTVAAKGTAWGLVNGVTAYLDHVRQVHTVDARLDHLWFGNGRTIKAKALEKALKMV